MFPIGGDPGEGSLTPTPATSTLSTWVSSELAASTPKKILGEPVQKVL